MPATLAIGLGAPWDAPSHGAAQRQLGLLRGITRAGPVDYVALGPRREYRGDLPNGFRSVTNLHAPMRPIGARGHLEWLTTETLRSFRGPGRPPYEMSRYKPLATETVVELRRLASSADFVWFTRPAAAYAALPGLRDLPAPTAIDFDDLEARKIQAMLSVPSTGRAWHQQYRRFELTLNARAWSRWTRALALLASRAVFASDVDSDAADIPNAFTVRNGTTVPPFRGARAPSALPTILYHGLMTYGPNRDGANYLGREILPQLRAELGDDFTVRIVGKAPSDVVALGSDPNIVVTGYVPELDDELERADVCAVPLRIGAGTRIKILEAMAHQIPVVSTSVGCEGLDLTPGVHLLVADDPRDFARQCRAAATDTALRARVVAAAYDIVRDRYDWRRIESDMIELVETITR